MKILFNNSDIPEILYNHISLEQAIRDFRLNTLIPIFYDILNRTTNICLRDNYNTLDEVILKLDSNLVKNHYYLEDYNNNVYLVSQPIKELNKFLKKIMIRKNIKKDFPEDYKEIEKYSDRTEIPIIII